MRHEIPYRLTICSKGTDERGHHNQPRLHHQFGGLPNAPDVFAPIFIAEAQIGTQAVADIIAIENECSATSLMKFFFNRMRQSLFTST